MNKQELIETLNSAVPVVLGEGYNVHMPIGPYTLSVSVGEGLYSSPREGGLDLEDYDRVECAILDDDGLMSVKQIHSKFGTDCAKLCEAYGLGDDDDDGLCSWENMSTVMPYVSWDGVAMVANMIELHSPSAKDLI